MLWSNWNQKFEIDYETTFFTYSSSSTVKNWFIQFWIQFWSSAESINSKFLWTCIYFLYSIVKRKKFFLCIFVSFSFLSIIFLCRKAAQQYEFRSRTSLFCQYFQIWCYHCKIHRLKFSMQKYARDLWIVV